MRVEFWTDVYNVISDYNHINNDLQYAMIADYGIVLYFSANGKRDMNSQNMCIVPFIARPISLETRQKLSTPRYADTYAYTMANR